MDCPAIPVVGYREFSKTLHARALAERIPVNGSMELTLSCNLRCQHCYIGSYARDHAEKHELDTQAWVRVLDEVADAGTLWLLLTGGEPLLRPDFPTIYTHAKRKGFVVSLFTNGTRFTKDLLDLLQDLPPFIVDISLYGATQETYERVTRVPGSYSACMEGIESLMSRGIPLQLKTMVMTLNRHELGAMRAFAAGLGVRFRYDPMINAGFDGSHAPTGLRLTPEEVVRLDADDPERYNAWLEAVGQSKRDPTLLYQCGAGLFSYHIDAYGNLELCISSRYQAYNLREGSFVDGWRGKLHELRQLPAPENGGCSTCELHALCGHCPAWARLENGDAASRDSYLCEIGRLRKQLLAPDLE